MMLKTQISSKVDFSGFGTELFNYKQCNYYNILLLLYDFEFENVEIKTNMKLDILSSVESQKGAIAIDFVQR